MRCSRCEKNNAKYTVEYDTNFGKVKAYLCETCYRAALASRKKAEAETPVSETRCPFCGNTMEDYRHTGLLGCATCYRVFAKQLEPYVIRLQGDSEHRGKEVSEDPKYEAAQELRTLLKRQEEAVVAGNGSLALKLGRKADELKLLLFGDEEEE